MGFPVNSFVSQQVSPALLKVLLGMLAVSLVLSVALGSVPAGSQQNGEARRRIELLTEREREVLTQVGLGLNNTEIAGQLFLAEATVKTHIGHILAKLGLRDRVQMVVLAYDAGMVKPQAQHQAW